MAHAVPSNERNGEGNERRPPGFGGTIFLQQGAHVTVLDARGRIITVNDAWENFGRANGLDPAYRFVGVSYLQVCERALDDTHGNEGARDALDGISRILAAKEARFSLVYPCHAPDRQRWFLMYARPIARDAQGAVVSHIDVTSLHLAGLVPDETRRIASADGSATERLARLLVPGFAGMA
jgi:two-component system, chemotaxis family, CheB/CheR fusion protein